jgi:hypothetical protein
MMEEEVTSKAKFWRAIVHFGQTGQWQQNGFESKEAAEKAASVKASAVRRRRKHSQDVTWRAEAE